jgi:DNA-binding protein HU-beta
MNESERVLMMRAAYYSFSSRLTLSLPLFSFLFFQQVSQDKRINLSGFGTFKLSQRSARKGRNPQTGEEIQIKASKSVSFTAAKALKEKLN